MSAFPRVLSYQNSFLGSKFVVIGVVCCQEMRRNALFHKVLRVLTKYLKGITDKPLYLMSLPPKDPEIVRALYEAGISEMAFNIEIFDRTLAVKYMPGKGMIPLKRYLNSLSEAVKWLGRSGNVRSMLMVGFDPKDTLLEGVRTLCEIGVQPMLSVFRPMAGTPLEMMLPLNLDKILEIFERAAGICAEYGLRLGPSCPACQNNTLSLPKPLQIYTSTRLTNRDYCRENH